MVASLFLSVQVCFARLDIYLIHTSMITLLESLSNLLVFKKAGICSCSKKNIALIYQMNYFYSKSS